MKYIISLLIILSCGVSFADVYVVTNKDTDDIVSISDHADCVVTSAMKEKVIKNMDIKDVVLVYPPEYYTLKGNSIVPNMSKISQKEANDLKNHDYKAEEDSIYAHYKNKAIDEMIASGKIFKYDHKIKE